MTSSVFAISGLVVLVVAAQAIWGWVIAQGLIAGERASAARRSFPYCPWFPEARRCGRVLLVSSWLVLSLGEYVKLPVIVMSLAAWVHLPCGLILCAVGIVWHGRVMRGPDLHRGDRLYHAGCAFAWLLAFLACCSLITKLVTGAGEANQPDRGQPLSALGFAERYMTIPTATSLSNRHLTLTRCSRPHFAEELHDANLASASQSGEVVPLADKPSVALIWNALFRSS